MSLFFNASSVLSLLVITVALATFSVSILTMLV